MLWHVCEWAFSIYRNSYIYICIHIMPIWYITHTYTLLCSNQRTEVSWRWRRLQVWSWSQLGGRWNSSSLRRAFTKISTKRFTSLRSLGCKKTTHRLWIFSPSPPYWFVTSRPKPWMFWNEKNCWVCWPAMVSQPEDIWALSCFWVPIKSQMLGLRAFAMDWPAEKRNLLKSFWT